MFFKSKFGKQVHLANLSRPFGPKKFVQNSSILYYGIISAAKKSS